MTPSFHNVPATADITWRRAVVFPSGGKLVLFPNILLEETRNPQWDYVNIKRLVTHLPPTGVLVTAVNMPFDELVELPEDRAWSCHPHIHQVVIHGHCHPGEAATQLAIPCNQTGATVHVLSKTFFQSLREELGDPGYTIAWQQALEMLIGLKVDRISELEATLQTVPAANVDEVLVIADAAAYKAFSPGLDLTTASYLTDALSPAT